jgi:hypothetical protein
VSNSHSPSDGTPALVTLPPGTYHVEARAQDYAGVTTRATVPVVVEAGRVTAVHLEGDWKPAGHPKASELVRLPNGHAVGWRASEMSYVAHPVP